MSKRSASDRRVEHTERGREADTKDAVLIAAAEAFVQRGYAATSIDDVAERLGATKGFVYHYFRTKGELFVGIHRRALDMVTDVVRREYEVAAPAPERLRRMSKAHATMMVREWALMRLAAQHAEMNLAREGRTRGSKIDEILGLRVAYEAMFETVIADGITAGSFRPADAGLMARAVLGSLNWMSVWVRPAERRSDREVDEIASTIADFTVRGLRG